MTNLGKFIQSKRMEKGLDISYVASLLRVKKEYIMAIEHGYMDHFSSKVYYYGYLKQYLKLLNIDHINSIIEQELPIVNNDNILSLPNTSTEIFHPNFLFILIALIGTAVAYNLCSNFLDISHVNPITQELQKQTSKFVELR